MTFHYTADIKSGTVFEVFGNRVHILFPDFQYFWFGGYLLKQNGLCFLRNRTQISFPYMVDNLDHSTLLWVVYFGHARTELVFYLTVYSLIPEKFSKRPLRRSVDEIDRRRRLIVLRRQALSRDAGKGR
jgi:hypothetical protein